MPIGRWTAISSCRLSLPPVDLRRTVICMVERGKPRDDTETLAAFDDTKNDTALFVGWWDYYAVTGRLPLPVQVFQIWWYALNEEKLALGSDLETIRRTFPGITSCDRTERKRRLRAAG